jgi:hypothetical protein
VLLGCAQPPVSLANATTAPPATCRVALAEAAHEFCRRAPGVYPSYASLDWSCRFDDDGSMIEIAPGRTWRFVAGAVADDMVTAHAVRWLDAPARAEAWTPVANQELALARRRDGRSLVIAIETERSAMPLAQHPLVVEFIARMKRVLDACRT